MTTLFSDVAHNVRVYQSELAKIREEAKLALQKEREQQWPSVREEIAALLTKWIAPHPSTLEGGCHQLLDDAEQNLFQNWEEYLLFEGISLGVHYHRYYNGYQMGDCGVDITYTVYWGNSVGKGIVAKSSDQDSSFRTLS